MLYLAIQMKEASERFPEWDLVIVGAGPAGAVAALRMVGKGYKVALIDKAVFPRDKICGDALSLDVVQQIPWVSESLASRFEKLEKRQPIYGGKMIAPNKQRVSLSLGSTDAGEGYVVSRIDLDNMFVEEVKSHPEIHLFEDTEIKEITQDGNLIRLQTNKEDFLTRLVLGADGNHSLVAKQLGGRKQLDRKHHCAALRQYYENVEWPEGANEIELHFIDEVLPGYLWVFPMTENRANVGIGMLSEDVSKRKINLKKVLEQQLQEHPELVKRFANARPLESVKGFGIPIGSKRYSLSGNNFLLAGDAACLVDPVSGEGIANAIRSGRFAAEYLCKALDENRTDAAFLKQYDKKIYQLVGDELRFSRFLQRIFRYKFLLNRVASTLAKSDGMRKRVHRLFYEDMVFGDWAKAKFYKKQLKRIISLSK